MDKNRSMVDVAYELMSKKKKAVNFYKLWQEVSEVKGFEEDEKDESLVICGGGFPLKRIFILYKHHFRRTFYYSW